MMDEIAVLEKQLDEFELLLTGGLRLSDKRLVDRVDQLRNQLKSRCLKVELSVELVKNPIEKLVALLNVVNNVSFLAEFVTNFYFSQMICNLVKKFEQ